MAGVQGEVLDSLDMFGVTARFPEQVAEAAKVAQGIEGLPPANEVDNVLVLGMGGSGIAADVCRVRASGSARIAAAIAWQMCAWRRATGLSACRSIGNASPTAALLSPRSTPANQM